MSAVSGPAFARVVWSVIAEPGDAVVGELVGAFGAEESLSLARRAVDGDDAGLVEHLGAAMSAAGDPAAVRTVLASAFERWRPRVADAEDRARAALAAGAAVGARLIVPEDGAWPGGLDDLGPHAPVVLWSRSEQDDPVGTPGCSGSIAIVGCRANTIAGAEAAADISSVAADAGLEIVSGGAYGIDAVAHRVAVAAGTPTTAVLAGGVDQFYPAGNHELLRNVLGRGRVLSESPPGTRPTRWRFLNRNRLIAALSDATVVVEAAARSGALNTAHHALQLGRPVFAVPGSFASAASVGCHRLVAEGHAQIVVGPRDPVTAVLEGTGVVAPWAVAGPPTRSGSGSGPEPRPRARRTAASRAAPSALATGADPHVQRALDALDLRPITDEEVARRSGLSVDDAADALALAQLEGLVVFSAEGWCRP